MTRCCFFLLRSTGKEFALKIINKAKCVGKVSPSSHLFSTFSMIQQNAQQTHLDDSCFQEHLIENEVSVLRQVKHPNIIMLIEEVDTSSELYLVMELVKVRVTVKRVNGETSFSTTCCKENPLPLVQGGDLFDAITSSAKYTERDASIMVYNLAAALKYLHSINIVHRDIKPENLLVFIAAALPVSKPSLARR